MTGLMPAVLRRDLYSFIWMVLQTVHPGVSFLPNWHIEVIVFQLMRIHTGENHRLLINQPPRSLKSICISIGYVAWLLGHNPKRRVVVVSYSSEFAAELHRQFRMVIEAPWYQALFPGMRAAKDTGTEFVTTAGGGRFATSIGGTLTGRGADLIIIDDPLKAEDALSEPARKRVIDWYSGTLLSRLNDKRMGSIIVVMQRLHEDDLAGYLIAQDNWYHLNLPAIALEDSRIPLTGERYHRRAVGDVLHPERESQETLGKIKAEIGSLQFSAQYQQSPIPVEGNLIKRTWFKSYDQLPVRTQQTLVVQSWDIAMMTGATNDYSVCTTWWVTGKDYHLIAVYRGRLQYPDLRREVAAQATLHGAAIILIEEAGPGMSLLQDLQHDTPDGMIRPIGVKPEGSKADRMAAQSAKIEAGHVHLPPEAAWLDRFLLEMLAFPSGRHDDQVDSVSQFLKWASSRWTNQNQKIGLISVGGRHDNEDEDYFNDGYFSVSARWRNF